MQNSGDQNIVFLTIVDDVVLDREGSYAGAELRTCTAHPRLFGQQIESVDDVVDQSVGGCRTGLLSDLGPGLVEVQFGQSR
jgi:hypothetical protein